MAADLDSGRSLDPFKRAEHRNFDSQMRDLVGGDRGKPWIVAARRDRASRDDRPERLVPAQMTDASAERVTVVERDEHGGFYGEDGRRRRRRRGTSFRVRSNGV